MCRSLLYVGPGREDDTSWEQRTGGVEGPVLAALRPLSANAVRSKVPRLLNSSIFLISVQHEQTHCSLGMACHVHTLLYMCQVTVKLDAARLL